MLPLISVFTLFLAGINAQAPELTIETSIGNITGIINGTTPSVRQFLSIPYAQPPVKDLRFLPPQPLGTVNASVSIDATRFPPSCPQFVTRVPSVYNQYATAWQPSKYDQSQDAGASLDTSSEDCLYLAIWTPANATNTSSLPVLFFMTGGAFVTGGVDIPVQIPSHWVERTQSHIVVTINYRVNIFGFPNSAALSDQNLGILDQRAALEWIHTNIAAFGGDPSRITLWGQSAGAVSVDILNFAFPSDPIAATMFAESGAAYLVSFIGSTDYPQSNFTYLANALGCNSTSNNNTEILSCMQSLDATTITNALGSYTDNRTQSEPTLIFAPIADEKVVFANYTDRYIRGAYANLPMIYSYTADEGVPFVPYPANVSDGINTTAAAELTAQAFLCPAAASSLLRSQISPSTPTYRSAYYGNFSNISPIPWFGAFHASDLAMYFGTYQDLVDPITGEGYTDFEKNVSEVMQDYLLAFARGGGKMVSGWDTYQQGKIVEFANGTSAVSEGNVASVDGVCAL